MGIFASLRGFASVHDQQGLILVPPRSIGARAGAFALRSENMLASIRSLHLVFWVAACGVIAGCWISNPPPATRLAPVVTGGSIPEAEREVWLRFTPEGADYSVDLPEMPREINEPSLSDA